MNKGAKIYVAGHNGLLGSAVVRRLRAEGYSNLLVIGSGGLDLTNQKDVNDFFDANKPEYVFICAGKVGGILVNNTQRADFIYQNLMIQANIIHAAYLNDVTKLLAIGSSCSYPRNAAQPIAESSLLTGELEPTNEPYAISKIAGIKMADAYRSQYDCNFISATPTNLYGSENENFDLNNSHVLPALIRKFITAHKRGEDVTIWGTGKPRREFMHVDDAADGCVFLMNNYDELGHVNLGTGVDHEINIVAAMIADIIGFKGKILHDTSKPDGMMVKRVDVTKVTFLGWTASIDLRTGLYDVIKKVQDRWF